MRTCRLNGAAEGRGNERRGRRPPVSALVTRLSVWAAVGSCCALLLATAPAVAQGTYQFREASIACTSRDDAESRAQLLAEGDTVAVRRYAEQRCFRVRAGTIVRFTRESALGRSPWVEVWRIDGVRLNNTPDAEGRPILRGWVRRDWLDLVGVC